MSIRTLIVFCLAIVCGASAAFGVYRFWELTEQQRQQIVKAPQETVPVVTASIEIPFVGTRLSEETIKIRQWPKGFEPAGAISDPKEVVGKTIHVPLRKGEPVLIGKFGDGRGMASLVEDGYRAFTIHTPSNTAGVAGFVLPGDHVDVLLTRTGNETTGGSVTTALLQNVTVLASDQMINAPEEHRVRGLKSVTLLVSPQEGQRLTLAQSGGTLTLMLRNNSDQEMFTARPFTWRDVEHSQDYSEEQASMLLTMGETIGDVLKHVAKSGADAMKTMHDQAKLAEARRLAMEQAEEDKSKAVMKPELPSQPPQILTVRGTSTGTVVIQ